MVLFGMTLGVPLYLYDIVFDELVEYYSDWELYDVILFKTKNKPYYKALHGTFAEPAKVPANLRSLVVDGGIDRGREELGKIQLG